MQQSMPDVVRGKGLRVGGRPDLMCCLSRVLVLVLVLWAYEVHEMRALDLAPQAQGTPVDTRVWKLSGRDGYWAPGTDSQTDSQSVKRGNTVKWVARMDR